jgi:hypothetical protein
VDLRVSWGRGGASYETSEGSTHIPERDTLATARSIHPDPDRDPDRDPDPDLHP